MNEKVLNELICFSNQLFFWKFKRCHPSFYRHCTGCISILRVKLRCLEKCLNALLCFHLLFLFINFMLFLRLRVIGRLVCLSFFQLLLLIFYHRVNFLILHVFLLFCDIFIFKLCFLLHLLNHFHLF